MSNHRKLRFNLCGGTNLILAASVLCSSANAIAQKPEASVSNPYTQPANFDALPDTCKAPVYPKISRRNNEQGEVEMSLSVGPSGDLLEARVITSSGYPNLDSAALKAVATCRFASAGNDIVQRMKVKYTFAVGNP